VTVRYANDLLLTDLARRITNEWVQLNIELTNGQLDAALETGRKVEKNLEGLMTRLKDVKSGSA
jgi:hypothetical protein